jgi:hypothetical protein
MDLLLGIGVWAVTLGLAGVVARVGWTLIGPLVDPKLRAARRAPKDTSADDPVECRGDS